MNRRAYRVSCATRRARIGELEPTGRGLAKELALVAAVILALLACGVRL